MYTGFMYNLICYAYYREQNYIQKPYKFTVTMLHSTIEGTIQKLFID